MHVSPRSLSACVIVAVSCLVWTAAISAALVHVFHFPVAVGWSVAGLLSLVSAMAAIVIFHGIKHATHVADHVDPGHSIQPDLSPNGSKSGGRNSH